MYNKYCCIYLTRVKIALFKPETLYTLMVNILCLITLKTTKNNYGCYFMMQNRPKWNVIANGSCFQIKNPDNENLLETQLALKGIVVPNTPNRCKWILML